ncbi:probable protein phosphatase 2C 37 [Brachypodium distachyon]|nr:probable protein phosphatase 2C 37 [Brachypodium distachyon]|eukprot:XP_003580929.2 probable protein phosphatase 2C 37 [Brachypodium distachyon]
MASAAGSTNNVGAAGGGEGTFSSSSSSNLRARRRRIAAAAAAMARSGSDVPAEPADPATTPAVVCALPAAAPVAFGSVALAGRMRQMEDVVLLRPGFFVWADGSPMNLFAVFDGHGGPHVAEICKQQMPAALEEELSAAAARLHGQQQQPTVRDEVAAWIEALRRAFARVDAVGGRCCQCGHVAPPEEDVGRRPLSSCPMCRLPGDIIGSTAVVALLVRDLIVVANSGDSRAVICRDHGCAVALSTDHKPDRPDEMRRIIEAGGQVIFNNGVRVRGILAMSRAIGHRILKPEVICDPEIRLTRRLEDDDCLILASDGVWDVISNQMACDVVRQCLQDGSPPDVDPIAAQEGQQQQSTPRCDMAAAALGRLALGRESSDNISAVVIDLKMRE